MWCCMCNRHTHTHTHTHTHIHHTSDTSGVECRHLLFCCVALLLLPSFFPPVHSQQANANARKSQTKNSSWWRGGGRGALALIRDLLSARGTQAGAGASTWGEGICSPEQRLLEILFRLDPGCLFFLRGAANQMVIQPSMCVCVCVCVCVCRCLFEQC